MMTEVTQAILDRLKDRGLDVREIAFKDLIDGTINLTRPAVNITMNQASVKRVAVNTYKYVTIVSLILVVNHLKGGAIGDGQRKSKIYELIEGISNYLTLQDFGLALENPMIPMGFNNITTTTLAKVGYSLYELKFWCSWNVDKEELDSPIIESLLINYWLEPELTNAEPPQASDVVDLT